MTWKEFSALLGGLSAETPLGKIVTIRAETDRNVIKHFTKEQKKIYDDYHKKRAETMSREQYNREMKLLEQEIAKLFI